MNNSSMINNNSIAENQDLSNQNYKILEKNSYEMDLNKNNLKFNFESFFKVFKCSLCTLFDYDPYICSKCQSLYCNKCIIKNKKINTLNTCPKGCDNINYQKLSGPSLSLLNCLEVSCTDCSNYSIKKKDKNLKTIFGLNDYINHLKICKYRICYCMGCNEEKTLDEIEFHLKSCIKLKKECPHCKQSFDNNEFQRHTLNCTLKTFICDECNIEVPRNNIKFHMDYECKLEIKSKLEKIENKLRMTEKERDQLILKINNSNEKYNKHVNNPENEFSKNFKKSGTNEKRAQSNSNYCDYNKIINQDNKSLIKLSNYTNEVDNVLPLDTSIVIDNLNESTSSKKSKALPFNSKQIQNNNKNNNNIKEQVFLGSKKEEPIKFIHNNKEVINKANNDLNIENISNKLKEESLLQKIPLKNVELVKTEEYKHQFIEFLTVIEPLKTVDFYDYSTNNLKDLDDKNSNEGVSFYSIGECIFYLKQEKIIETLSYRYMKKIEEDFELISSVDCKNTKYIYNSATYATFSLYDEKGTLIEIINVKKENLTGKIVEVSINNMKPVKSIVLLMAEKYILLNIFGIDYFSIKTPEKQARCSSMSKKTCITTTNNNNYEQYGSMNLTNLNVNKFINDSNSNYSNLISSKTYDSVYLITSDKENLKIKDGKILNLLEKKNNYSPVFENCIQIIFQLNISKKFELIEMIGTGNANVMIFSSSEEIGPWVEIGNVYYDSIKKAKIVKVMSCFSKYLKLKSSTRFNLFSLNYQSISQNYTGTSNQKLIRDYSSNFPLNDIDIKNLANNKQFLMGNINNSYLNMELSTLKSITAITLKCNSSSLSNKNLFYKTSVFGSNDGITFDFIAKIPSFTYFTNGAYSIKFNKPVFLKQIKLESEGLVQISELSIS